MAKELAVKQENKLSTEVMSDWGVQALSSQDVIIPQILLMQGLSKSVASGAAMMGEFRDSVSNTLLGKLDQPYECIPFYMQKVWDVYDKEKNKWAKTIPVVENPLAKDYNDNWNMEQTIDGKVMKVVKRFNFFILLPHELETNPNALPYFVSFKSTSFREGRKLATQMYVRNISEKQPPFKYTIKMSGARQQNDKGIFCVPGYQLGRETTKEEQAICMNWIKVLRGGAVKMDETEVQGEAEVSTEF